MIVNGKEEPAAGRTVAQLLREREVPLGNVAVERNEAILPRSQYETTVLTDADRLEIVSFVGGG
ncbi:sulfur carrier protein ThiS [Acidaminococcus sp.]|uniref:sulfur carrier protein ThiS n=1 Tax=Acidaminococcus sp. TaxID=1872103 RepID=UPI003D7E89A9